MQSDDISIRRADKTEKEKLKNFLTVIFGKEMAGLADKYVDCMFSEDYRRPHFVVALNSDQEIIGAAAYSEELFTVNVWGISWVAVRDDCRNRRIGRALVNRCLRDIAEKAIEGVTVILATYPGKTRLYEQCGFIEAGNDCAGGSFMIKTVEGRK